MVGLEILNYRKKGPETRYVGTLSSDTCWCCWPHNSGIPSENLVAATSSCIRKVTTERVQVLRWGFRKWRSVAIPDCDFWVAFPLLSPVADPTDPGSVGPVPLGAGLE